MRSRKYFGLVSMPRAALRLFEEGPVRFPHFVVHTAEFRRHDQRQADQVLERQLFDQRATFRRAHSSECRRCEPGAAAGVCLGDRRVLDAHSGDFVALTLPYKLVDLAIPRRCPGYPVMLYGPTVYTAKGQPKGGEKRLGEL